MEKWARVNYQPPIGLGENGARITGCKEHIEISKEAAKEGMVLLKNNNGLLPIKKGTKVALFGKACIDYVKGGGSGDVTVAYIKNLYDGLKAYADNHEIEIYEPLVDFYKTDVKRQYDEKALPGMTIEPTVPTDLLEGAKNFADVAIISICRYSGEDWDRKLEGTEIKAAYAWSQEFLDTSDKIFDRGDFYLTTKEQQMVDVVTANFKQVVVVMNVGGMVDTMWFAENDAISSVLMAWQAGMEGGVATADILMGTDNPCGKLSDTFAKQITDYPSTDSFHVSTDYAEYVEDIYVGYRYFETIPEKKACVNYPFGYGLSYTKFGFNCSGAWLTKNNVVKVFIDVKNVGEYAGKEVVELYYGAPQGKLGKPEKVLGAFVKTKLLQPGEIQSIELAVPTEQMASYDDKGMICKSAYILEAGTYHIYVGNNVRDAKEVMNFDIPEDKVVEQLSEKCKPYKLTKRMLSDGSFEAVESSDYPADACQLQRQPFEAYEGICPEVLEQPRFCFHDKDRLSFRAVADGTMSLEAFMDQLTIDELIDLTCGHKGTGIANTGSMGGFGKYDIPAVNTADGPAGLRIREECCVTTTAFPCATLLASTWNPDIVYKVGETGAKEVKENNISIWLTPAVNIHRSPLCGRNFEYYSEDPYLSGVIGAAMVNGMQSQNIGASVKHFAANNKETNRKDSDSIVSERALREIYLKAFEIIVKESNPWTIMSSYNLLNGQHTSENKDLLTGILRDEWGYQGVVTTDWWTHAEHYMETKAGNDIKMMNGYRERVKEAYDKGYISKDEIYLSAKRVLEMLLKVE